MSGAGLCLDYAVYVTLCATGMSAGWANLVSASVGVTFVFVVSARHIFESSDRFLVGLFALYALYQVVAISAASLAVDRATDALDGAYVLGKTAVLPFTFACNYLFMSWLFKTRSPRARAHGAPARSAAADRPAAETPAPSPPTASGTPTSS